MDFLNYTYIDRQQPVLLLIHGFLGSMNQWRYIEKELSNNFSILKIDLPGHGSSPEFSTHYSLSDIAVLIENILVTENIDRVHIIGHSMGGYIGAAFAKAKFKKTLSLTMINSIAGMDPVERKLMRNRSIQLIEKHQEAYINMAIANLFTADERRMFNSRIEEMKVQAHNISIASIVQSLIAMRDRSDSLEALKELEKPINYIYGLKDEVITPNHIISECEFLSIKGNSINCGHMSLLTNVRNILELLHLID